MLELPLYSGRTLNFCSLFIEPYKEGAQNWFLALGPTTPFRTERGAEGSQDLGERLFRFGLGLSLLLPVINTIIIFIRYCFTGGKEGTIDERVNNLPANVPPQEKLPAAEKPLESPLPPIPSPEKRD